MIYKKITTKLTYLKFKAQFSKELKIFTHLTFDEKYLLYRLTKGLPSKSISAEIGSFLGSSSCFIAAGIDSSSKLYCIDTWGNHAMKYVNTDTDAEERDTFIEFNENTKKYNQKIIQLRGWSYDMIRDLKKQESKLDFLFIDGDHNYEGVKKDWDLYSPLLKTNSIVVFHDIEWADGVKKVVEADVKHLAKEEGWLPNMYYAILK